MKYNTQTEPDNTSEGWGKKYYHKFVEISDYENIKETSALVIQEHNWDKIAVIIDQAIQSERERTKRLLSIANSKGEAWRRGYQKGVKEEREFWQDRVKKLDRRIEELTKMKVTLSDNPFDNIISDDKENK